MQLEWSPRGREAQAPHQLLQDGATWIVVMNLALLETAWRNMREHLRPSIGFRKAHLQSQFDVIEFDDDQIRIDGSGDVPERAYFGRAARTQGEVATPHSTARNAPTKHAMQDRRHLVACARLAPSAPRPS
jgi:hypothetical protein